MFEDRRRKENNLKNIDVKIPLGVMTCVTGVSDQVKVRWSMRSFIKISGEEAEPCQNDSGKAQKDRRCGAVGQGDRYRSVTNWSNTEIQSGNIYGCV